MLHLYQLIELVAETDVTVHIQGETGVGKELVADAIHHLSARRTARFVKLNCSAIPSTLLESALFGHVRGSFTDAYRDQPGYIETAHGGTILLDEIGEISPDLQVKLLRLLQSHEYARLGEPVVRHANVRVITATNRDLKELVERGRIREDFFYRVNVFPLIVPPLRARASDIPLLAMHFLKACNARFSRSVEGFTPEALQAMREYTWPGNVRELENAIEHALVILRTGMIDRNSLPSAIADWRSPLTRRIEKASTALDWRQLTPEQESVAIQEALEQANGVRSRAASILGISRVSLWKRLKKLKKTAGFSQGEVEG